MGNLDNMMQSYEGITKIEAKIEGIIKKITKAYLEVNPKGDALKLTVETKNLGAVSITKFLQNFKWDESKYPRNQNLTDLIKIITQRSNTVENNLRHKINAFHSSRDRVNLSAKKDQSSIQTRDLNELFSKNKKLKNTDFPDTKNLKTMIAVVPQEKVKKWLAEYESINEYIVPRSAKVFDVGDIGSFSLIRIVFFRRVSDDIEQQAKQKFKIILRDFKYDINVIMQNEADKVTARNKSHSDQDALLKTCTESFKDIYSTYIHIKILKVSVDSQMRFGSHEDYCLILIKVKKGKEKKIHKSLINIFAEPSKRDMFGTKEALGEIEDFFPYSYALISQPEKL